MEYIPMKALLLMLLLTPAAYANFPVKQSQTWQVTEDKIYVSNQNERVWEINHTCDEYNIKDASVSITFNERTRFGINQSRVRKNALFELSVNGKPQMCRVESVSKLR